MTVADEIRESWAWLGIDLAHVIEINKFGNVVFTDSKGKYWRLRPEELECKPIAASATDYERLLSESEFVQDWDMARLVTVAEAKFGKQPVDRCFCLKTPGVLGGAYDIQNIGTISVSELIRFSGDVARQIKDVPSGSKVQFKVVD